MKKLLFFLLIPVFGICQIPEFKPNTYINDFAGILADGQVGVLNDSIRVLETKTGVQLAIVLVKDLPPDMEIEDYALQIGRKWHVGYTNGVVYVAVMNTHKQRLEVADKMQGAIPDIEAQHILDGIKPFFKSSQWLDGLQYLVQQVDIRTEPEKNEQLQIVQSKVQPVANFDVSKLLFFLILCICLAFVLYQAYVFLYSEEDEKNDDKSVVKPNMPINKEDNEQVFRPMTTTIKKAKISPPLIIENNDEEEDIKRTKSSGDDPETKEVFGDWGVGQDNDKITDSGFSGGGASDTWD